MGFKRDFFNNRFTKQATEKTVLTVDHRQDVDVVIIGPIVYPVGKRWVVFQSFKANWNLIKQSFQKLL